jgi:hypothetical protein
MISISSATAYTTPAHFLITYDARDVADLLNDFGTRVNPANILVPATPPYTTLVSFLNRGAGLIEAACVASNRYTPTDLQALTGVSQEMLMELNDHMAYWKLWSRRPNRSKPLPADTELSFQLLDQLRQGERIFAFAEAAKAGNIPDPQFLTGQDLITRNFSSIYARRFFGLRAQWFVPGPSGSGVFPRDDDD